MSRHEQKHHNTKRHIAMRLKSRDKHCSFPRGDHGKPLSLRTAGSPPWPLSYDLQKSPLPRFPELRGSEWLLERSDRGGQPASLCTGVAPEKTNQSVCDFCPPRVARWEVLRWGTLLRDLACVAKRRVYIARA
eukprot:704568-Amphidinium_carterae.2